MGLHQVEEKAGGIVHNGPFDCYTTQERRDIMGTPRFLMLGLTALLALLGGAIPDARADLFVSSFNTNQVLEYNGTTGAFVGVFASGGGLSGSNGLAFGPNGDLFVASQRTDQVLEYNGSTGAFVKVFASSNISEPQGLSFGPNGDLFVSNTGTFRVTEYNGTTGVFVKTFSGGAAGATGLTFGPNGNVFVGSGIAASVEEFNGKTGADLGQFVTSGSGGLFSPTGLTFGPNGDLFVSNNTQVLEYNGTTGAFVKVFASGGNLAEANGLLFGPNGDLFVSSQGIAGSQVLEFNGTTGAFDKVFASGGGLSAPTYLAFSPPPAVTGVPEPSSLLLFGLGSLALAASRWRRRASRGHFDLLSRDMLCESGIARLFVSVYR